MRRSSLIWLLLGLGLVVIWFARDQISAYVPQLTFSTSSRTTNTQELAKTITPAEQIGMQSSAARITPISRSGRITPISRDSVTAAGGSSGVASARNLGIATTTPSVARATARPTITIRASNLSSASSSRDTAYTVKAGDTLYSIAKKYDVELETLMQVNGITDPTTLKVDQTLQIPGAPAPIATAGSQSLSVGTPPPGTTTYTVKAGDTLSSISRALGISLGELQRLNSLPNPNELTVGMNLIVPPGAASASLPSANGAIATRAPVTSPQPSPTPNPATPTPGAPPPSRSDTSTSSIDVSEDGSTVSGSVIQTIPTISTASTPTPLPLPTLSLAPTSPPVTPTPVAFPVAETMCPAGESIVLVWGPSFCLPDDWQIIEKGAPNRGVFAIHDEPGQDRAVLGIVHLEGITNAPMSLAIRTAKGSSQSLANLVIPGGIAEPTDWSQIQSVSVAGLSGQMSEAATRYGATSHNVRIRVIAFSNEGDIWMLLMIAPQGRWGYYTEAGFPTITSTLSVF